jgi:L-alanine-DL-glutamate epimerase-like enolase superfamily enzyme
MKVMLGCMTETSCAVSAAAQLSPAVDFADLDGNLLISNDRFSGVGLSEGRLVLPAAPGIGVTPL